MEEEQNTFNVERIVTYWLTEATDSLKVAYHLIEKHDYSYALFFGHLAIEKTLKALYVQRLHQHAPFIHNLLRLAHLCKLEPNEAQTEALLTITAFNIEARYPDIKRAFRAQCTREFTTQQMHNIQEVLKWLNSQFPLTPASNASSSCCNNA